MVGRPIKYHRNSVMLWSMEHLSFGLLERNDVTELMLWYRDTELANRYGGHDWPQKLWPILLQEKNRQCWMVRMNNEQVGFVDFEMNPMENLAWIGLVIKPELRNKGLGKRILQEFLAQSSVRSFSEIRAGIEPDNIASVRCFTALGFKPLHEKPDEEGIIDYSLVFKPSRR